MHTGSEAEELGDRKLIGDKSAATPASGADTTSCVRVWAPRFSSFRRGSSSLAEAVATAAHFTPATCPS